MTTFARALLAVALIVITACGDDRDETEAGAGARPTTFVPTPSVEPVATTAASGADGRDPRRPTETAPGSTISAAPASTDPRPTTLGIEDASVYAPPPGRYVYDATGTVTTAGLTGTVETEVPTSSTDDIRVSDEPAAMRMTVITRDEGRDSTQELVVAVTDTGARLVRLSQRPDTGVGYSVNPDPPVMLARLPYRTGDSWEMAWNDPTSGISGVGSGSVERRETVTTPAGVFDTVVITVTQRLRGTVTGTLAVTTWIDPATGIQPRQHLVTDLRDAAGASRTDTTRTLRQLPA